MKVVYNKSNEPKRKAIECPRCKSKEIAIITEYHKANWARCLLTLFILITGILAILAYGKENFTNILLVGGISILAVQIYIADVESKTHIQCICKDCGWIWFHDNLL